MKNLIRQFIDRCHRDKLSIHCIGDAMIDEYYEVRINKISTEHPLPVMRCQNDIISKPGGASNVAYQFNNVNAEVNLFTLNDNLANKIYKNFNFNHYPLGTSANLPIKRRFTQDYRQVCSRLDIEFENCNLSNESLNEIFEELKYHIKNKFVPDVVIFSDYNKGFFNSNKNFISLYPNSITIVDPKSDDLDKWQNCTVFKPNAQEAFDLSGISNWKDQCKYFIKKLNCKSVVITYSGNGVKGFDGSQYFEYSPEIEHISVESVIGAGDCFAAFLGLALGHGFSLESSSKIAHHAGLMYVQNKQNRPIVLAELVPDKIINSLDIVKRDFSLAFTNGCFDILHIGHLETLKFAKSKADKLVVAVNSDDSIKRLKGLNRPIVSLEHRQAILAALNMVDFVIPFNDNTPKEIIELIKPNCLIKGGDYQSDEIIGREFVEEVYIAPFISNYSSSKFIKIIEE